MMISSDRRRTLADASWEVEVDVETYNRLSGLLFRSDLDAVPAGTGRWNDRTPAFGAESSSADETKIERTGNLLFKTIFVRQFGVAAEASICVLMAGSKLGLRLSKSLCA
jgi:hypothetical protein